MKKCMFFYKNNSHFILLRPVERDEHFNIYFPSIVIKHWPELSLNRYLVLYNMKNVIIACILILY